MTDWDAPLLSPVLWRLTLYSFLLGRHAKAMGGRRPETSWRSITVSESGRASYRHGLAAAALAALTVGPAFAQEAAPLRLVQTIPLPNVVGRIDHLAVDLKGQRLFVAALGNNTVEIVDLRSGTWVRSLTGFQEPQGVAFIEGLGKLFVSNGGTGAVNIFGGESL